MSMKNSSEIGSGFVPIILYAILICIGASVLGLAFNSLYIKQLQWWQPEKYKYIFEEAAKKSAENPEDKNPQPENPADVDPQPTNSCEPYSITIDEAYFDYFQDGDVIFIDTRFESEFSEGHIKGAINIPKDQTSYVFDKIKDQLPLDATYIFYCSAGCDSSMTTAFKFCNEGYRDGQILVSMDEYQYWVDAEYPTE